MNKSFWIFAISLLGVNGNWNGMSAEEEKMKTLIIAHRGASALAPENTLASIQAAAEAGADGVEWDTRVTADGILILQHDDTLERYLGKKGKVKVVEMTFAESQHYDLGWWFAKEFEGEKMPTLQQAIEASLPKLMPLIERKTGSAQQHVEVIRKLKVEDRVVVQAFDWKFLKDLRRLAPEIRMGALGSKPIKEKQFKQLFALQPEYVGWGSGDLKRSDVERFHQKGIKVLVWTVDGEKEIAKFVEWGIDGIITNDPGNTRKVVERTSNKQLESLLPPLLGEHTCLLTLQNGLGNGEFLAQRFGEQRVMGGLCFVCLNRISPGVIRHLGFGLIMMGELHAAASERTREVGEWFSRSGVACEVVEDLMS